MEPSNRTPINVPWSPDRGTSTFEILTRRQLVDRFGDMLWCNAERLQFDMVAHCTSGCGTHMVDLEEVSLEPGAILHVRPGQIHQWREEPDFEATLILIRTYRSTPRAHWPSRPEATMLSPAQRKRLELAYELYGSIVEPGWTAGLSPERRELAVLALRDLFQSILGIPAEVDEGSVGGEGPYFEFRADVERHLDHRQTVQARAARLGYSTRTLDRACQAVVGMTAKRLVDERLALEARRMLVLPDSQASAVARALGFDEATNFSKFVKRVTGQLPSAWQTSAQVVG